MSSITMNKFPEGLDVRMTPPRISCHEHKEDGQCVCEGETERKFMISSTQYFYLKSMDDMMILYNWFLQWSSASELDMEE